jgi:hypothetical protein
MSCSTETLSTASACTEYNSARKQKEALLLFLCGVAQDTIGGFSCNWATRLAAADAEGLLCLTPGQLRQKQAEIVCDGLDVECDALACYSTEQLEAMQLDLMCRIINEINP